MDNQIAAIQSALDAHSSALLASIVLGGFLHRVESGEHVPKEKLTEVDHAMRVMLSAALEMQSAVRQFRECGQLVATNES